jgi:hypothetical protein
MAQHGFNRSIENRGAVERMHRVPTLAAGLSFDFRRTCDRRNRRNLPSSYWLNATSIPVYDRRGGIDKRGPRFPRLSAHPATWGHGHAVESSEAAGLPATLYLYRNRLKIVAGRWQAEHERFIAKGQIARLPECLIGQVPSFAAELRLGKWRSHP